MADKTFETVLLISVDEDEASRSRVAKNVVFTECFGCMQML